MRQRGGSVPGSFHRVLLDYIQNTKQRTANEDAIGLAHGPGVGTITLGSKSKCLHDGLWKVQRFGVHWRSALLSLDFPCWLCRAGQPQAVCPVWFG